jgi:hypothetical protein
MDLLRRRGSRLGASSNLSVSAGIQAKLDEALTSVFSEEGKRTVLYHMSTSYSLTLEQASADPARLEAALTGMLGEIGWMVVKRKILEHFWERKIELQEVSVVKSASLQAAFGLIGGLGSAFSFGASPGAAW